MTPAQWYGWSWEVDLFNEPQAQRKITFLVIRRLELAARQGLEQGEEIKRACGYYERLDNAVPPKS